MQILRLILTIVLVGCGLPTQADGDASAARAMTQAWATALNACDAGSLAEMYDKEALLWGTLSQSLIATPEGIRAYFERACAAANKPAVALNEQTVRHFDDIAVSSGTYTFTVFPDGQAKTVSARYSFAFRKSEQGWKIVEHHSSPVPAAPATSAE